MKKIMLCLAWVFCAVVTNAQNIGIGTTAPLARLHVTDSNVVFTGPLTFTITTPFPPPIQGAGTRMMWYPQKAAFRAGFVSGTHWDKDSIGNHSFAVGANSMAIGERSFASGSSTASAEISVAMGSSTASGSFSTAMGRSTASGSTSTAMGFSAASALNSTAMGRSTASGSTSTAMGFSNASGQNSTAMGSSIAFGHYSTATGLSTSSGEFAFAGGASHAVAPYSTAFGFNNYARANGSVVLGVFNDTADSPDPNVLSPADRLFQIGNGDVSMRTNALTLLRNGNAGIGTTAPVARLHVADSNVVFTGPPTLGASTLYAPPIQGAGSRMMWYPQKAAFRAGFVNGTQWDKDNIGRFSFAVGSNSVASGEGSFAAGSSTASQNFSTALGSSFAFGFGSVSTGNSMASGSLSTSTGSSVASGQSSAAMGQSTATGLFSTALGFSTASSQYSTAAGASTASGNYSFAGGTSHAVAPSSTAFGWGTWAKAGGGVAMGISNDISDNPDPNVLSPADRIFQIGNGTSEETRGNALTVLRNGNMGIGTTNPIVKLYVSGGASGGAPYGGAQLAVEHLDHTYISMISPDLNETGILFGKSSSTVSGGVVYNNSATLNGLQFRTNGNQTRMSINSTGHVGIGTDAPFSPLTFNNITGQKISFYGNTSNNYGIGLQGGLLQIHTPAVVDDIAFGYGTSGSFTETMRIKGNGNAIIQGTLIVDGIFYPSDARYKRNLAFVQDALPRILQLNGYNYYWKDEANDPSLQTGLIAQEIKNIFPELVREDSTGYLSVNYTGLIPYLIESIKHQQKLIEDQTNHQKKLRDRIDELEKRDQKLEALQKEIAELRQMIKK